MLITAISKPQSPSDLILVQGHYRLRARVFCERLGWQVQVTEGLEKDFFDDLNPTYIIAGAENGEVVGCARLLPALGPTMVGNVFGELLPNGKLGAHARMLESSRFCVDTSWGIGRRTGTIHEATLTMFAGILEWCLSIGVTEVVTVTDLRFEKILNRVGWQLQRLAAPRQIGKTMAVAGILPVTVSLFEGLRPSAYSSQITKPIPQAA